ncbi:unnamed protein product [Eretmochelys imbricata]
MIGWRAWSRDGEPGPGSVPRLCCCQIGPTQTERSRPQPSTCSSICGLSVAERDNGASSWVAESEEPLQELCVNGNGHLETGGNPDLPWNCQKSPTCGVVVALIVVSSPLIAAIIALAGILSDALHWCTKELALVQFAAGSYQSEPHCSSASPGGVCPDVTASLLLPAPSAERLNNSSSWFVTRCATPNNHNGVEKQKSLFAAAKRSARTTEWDTEGNATISQRRKGAGPTAGAAAVHRVPPWLASTVSRKWVFLLRHKGVQDHWIGLRREQGQPWIWTNSTKFNHLFHLRGGGDCTYLNDQKGVSSSRCYMGRRWICSKPEVYVMVS